MRVLIMGGEGMLGHKVFEVMRERFEAFATFRQANGLWREYPMYKDVRPKQTVSGVDAVGFDTVIRSFAQVKPDVVINCIGIVKQVKEAKDPLKGIEINSLFPHRLAELCAAVGARMFHMSTDCVFSGKKGDYTEDDTPDPVDLYGRTKLLGEVDQENCLTIRTSIFGRDFLKSTALLEWFLSNRGGSIQGYTQAIYSGFPTKILAEIIQDLILDYPHLSGLYHIASDPISKYELLVKIREAMDLDIEIHPYEDFQCDRSLNSSKFERETGYVIPDWDRMIIELVEDKTPYNKWREVHNVIT